MNPLRGFWKPRAGIRFPTDRHPLTGMVGGEGVGIKDLAVQDTLVHIHGRALPVVAFRPVTNCGKFTGLIIRLAEESLSAVRVGTDAPCSPSPSVPPAPRFPMSTQVVPKSKGLASTYTILFYVITITCNSAANR